MDGGTNVHNTTVLVANFTQKLSYARETPVECHEGNKVGGPKMEHLRAGIFTSEFFLKDELN